jgi:exodeoxyribonuclease VII small subunit
VSKAAKAPSDDLPFEEALKKLEAVVEAMESDDLPLEQLLSRFEEGSKLVQVCQARLDEADVKVQKLELTFDGQLVPRSLSQGEPVDSAA